MKKKKNTLCQTGSKYKQPPILSGDVGLAPDATRGKQAKPLITLTVRHEVFKLHRIACLETNSRIFVSSKRVLDTYVRFFAASSLAKLTLNITSFLYAGLALLDRSI